MLHGLHVLHSYLWACNPQKLRPSLERKRAQKTTPMIPPILHTDPDKYRFRRALPSDKTHTPARIGIRTEPPGPPQRAAVTVTTSRTVSVTRSVTVTVTVSRPSGPVLVVA